MPDVSRVSSNVAGSDVLCPASRVFYDTEEDWQHTPAPEGDSQDQFSHEHSMKERLGTEHSEDHNKRLKLWAQKVATKFELKASQFSELSTLIDVGKHLETRDLHLQIWQQVANYKILNGIEEIKAHSVNTKNAVETATAGIKGGFQLTPDQAMQVLIICKDMIMQAGQTKYKQLHVDVEEWLKACANILGFQNVFGNPTNECILHAAIKKECSTVQNKFRMLILDSTSGEGKTCMTLEELTWTALSKYKWGGVGLGSKAKYQLHLVYLRYYGRVHQYLMGPAAAEESGIESCEEGATVEADTDISVNKPPAKRARSVTNKAPPGRVKSGHDFWSVIDKVFVKDIKQYGKDMRNDKWHIFFNEIIIQDQERYGRNSGSILFPLPSMYTESPEAVPSTMSSNPGMLPATGYPLVGQSARQSSMANMLPQPTHSSSDQLLTSDGTEDLLGEDF
ncbi:hypothetical protein EDC04DRAFT_3139282 [Pisolithus marmoratus]|nr:hypothetical protein EDC04DRAFT_3139282 [Pisolithus marmoratus]